MQISAGSTITQPQAPAAVQGGGRCPQSYISNIGQQSDLRVMQLPQIYRNVLLCL